MPPDKAGTGGLKDEDLLLFVSGAGNIEREGSVFPRLEYGKDRVELKMEDKNSVALSEISNVDKESPPRLMAPSGTAPTSFEPSQQLSLRGVIIIIGIVGTYFATMVHLVGSGLLAQTIAAYFHAPSQSTWLTLALIITPITLGPAVAQATDYWGRKWLIVVGMVFGFTGCIIASRSNSIGMAIAGQAIAGLSQPSQALTHAIMSEILPRKYRPYAQAAVQVSVSLASVTALYVGGALSRTNPEGFRNFFYFTAAIYFFNAMVFAVLYKPPPRELQHLSTWDKIRQFDIGGMCLTITSFLGICIGLGWSRNPYSWSSVRVWLPFTIGAVSFVLLVIYATLIKRDGIYHRDLFRSRNFVVAEICFFAEGFLFLAFNNYVPYQISFLYDKNLFQTALEYSIAWWMVPVGAFVGGIYAVRTKTIRPPIVFSFVLMAAFFGSMTATNLSSNIQVWGLVAIYGFGLGIAICVLVVLAQLSVRMELIATATGLLLATRAGGGTVGLAAYNALFNAAIASNLGSKVGEAAISHGLPPSSLGQLLGALTSNDQQALSHIPGITPHIIQASVLAMKEVFNIGFRHIYIMSTAMVGFALIVSCFIQNPKSQFTATVDAPLFNVRKRKEVTLISD